MSSLVTGRENKWDGTCYPKRFTPVAAAPKLARENFFVAKLLIKDCLFCGATYQLKDIKSGGGKTLEIEDEVLVAHRDETKQLHVV